MKNIFIEGIQGAGYSILPMVGYHIRPIDHAEYEVLSDFLYEAIFIPEGVDAPPREIINDPQLQVYVQDFGTRESDVCFVTETGGEIIGAAMMKRMLEELKVRGYDKTSLSVQKVNYAVKMYKKVGFEIVGENEEEYIMVCELNLPG